MAKLSKNGKRIGRPRIHPEKKNPVGRPKSFQEIFIHQAHSLCRDFGASDEQLQKHFKICETTLYKWKREYPEFAQAVIDGKDQFDNVIVENALLTRAKGFNYTEEVRELGDDGEMVVTKQTEKKALPDVKAQEFWLSNRNSNRWRKAKHVEIGTEGDKGLTVNINTNVPDPLQPDEWEKAK